MEYVVKGFMGLFKRILYKCPSCRQPLESKMSEAGSQDTCPICGTQFVVPGAEERLRREAEEEQRRKAEAAERARREAAIRHTQQQIEQEAKRLKELDNRVYDSFADSPEGHIDGPGDYAIEVVGESNYQEALQAACRKYGKEVEAVLILEDSNPYDPKAVQVQIDGRVCGYLSRDDARGYRKELKKAGHPSITVRCRASIEGGRVLGLRLDLPHKGSSGSRDSWRDEPATERQKAFADDLGIVYPKNITKGELSDMISEVTGE